MRRLVSALFAGRRVLTAVEEREARLAICRSCEHYDAARQGGACRVCGCILEWKRRLATEACPLGKWRAITPPRLRLRDFDAIADRLLRLAPLLHLPADPRLRMDQRVQSLALVLLAKLQLEADRRWPGDMAAYRAKAPLGSAVSKSPSVPPSAPGDVDAAPRG